MRGIIYLRVFVCVCVFVCGGGGIIRVYICVHGYQNGKICIAH